MISEVGGIDLFARMLALLHDVEILRPTCPMMRPDELDDLLWKTGFLRHLNPVKHMRDNDLSALNIGDIIMGIICTVLILSKIHRIRHLADVVIQRTSTSQQRVTSNRIKHLIAEIGHLDGVLECSGSRLCQLTQQRRIGVVQLHQRQGGGQTEHLLKQENQRQREHGEQSVQRQHAHHRPADRTRRKEGEGEINHQVSHKKQYRGDEIMAARLVTRQDEDHNHARHQLHEDILEGVWHRHRNQQHGDHLNGEGQARTIKRNHDHGEHHHWHHQDERRMNLHDQIRWDDHHHHQEQKQIDLA